MLVAALLLSVAMDVSALSAPGALRCELPSTHEALEVNATTAGARVQLAEASADSTLVALYERGETWEQFFGAARARRAMWERNAEGAVIAADVLAQATAVAGTWRLLVVSVDGCSDSVNTIPYIARLVALVPQLEMRIITPYEGRALMAARQTPDGRAATPTVVLLDDAGVEAGCWIERPAALQRIAMELRAGGGTAAFAAQKQGWYDTDRGASTVREIADLLTAAAGGKRGCDATTR